MGSGCRVPPFLTSALDGGEWSPSCPCRFVSKERDFGSHWIGGWVGPELAGTPWRRENYSRIRNQIVQFVAHLNTDWDSPTLCNAAVISWGMKTRCNIATPAARSVYQAQTSIHLSQSQDGHCSVHVNSGTASIYDAIKPWTWKVYVCCNSYNGKVSLIFCERMYCMQ
jgi:hypothetical protein